MFLWNCKIASAKFDRSDKWSFAARGNAKTTKILNTKDNKYGIAFTSDPKFDNVASLAAGATVSASETVNTNVNNPERIIDGSDEYWLSEPGV